MQTVVRFNYTTSSPIEPILLGGLADTLKRSESSEFLSLTNSDYYFIVDCDEDINIGGITAVIGDFGIGIECYKVTKFKEI